MLEFLMTNYETFTYPIISIIVGAIVYLVSKANDKTDRDFVNNMMTKTAVQFAVLKFINKRDVYRDKVKEIVISALARIDKNQLTDIVEIKNVIYSVIPWNKLDTAETLAVKNLTDLVFQQLKKKYEEHLIVDGSSLNAAEVLNWILEVVDLP